MSVLTKNFLMVEDTASMPRSKWSAEGSALVAEALRSCAHSPQHAHQPVRLRVHGESMLPALWPGEVVEVASCSMEDVRPGEIVLALREGRLFLHRLITSCTPNGFRLRGDSLPSCDPHYPPEALLGKVVRGSNTGRIPLAALSCALGMLICHCDVVRRVALKLYHRRSGPARGFRSVESL
jgi:signal peptidase I